MPKFVNDQYFEAIIQVRPVNEEVLGYIKRLIEKRGNVFISKQINEKFGVDLYISDRKYAMSIGKKLKDRFKEGRLITSKILQGYDRQNSKSRHRVVVCFKLEKKEI